MIFTTATYGLFLAMFGTIYWRLNSVRQRNSLLQAGSYTFYAWWDWRFCSLVLISSAWDFVSARMLARCASPQRRRVILFTSISLNLGLLGYFKLCWFLC